MKTNRPANPFTDGPPPDLDELLDYFMEKLLATKTPGEFVTVKAGELALLIAVLSASMEKLTARENETQNPR